MGGKNTALVLLSPLNTLLLVSGISILIWTTMSNFCDSYFCYAIEDFTSFYQKIFFTFGFLLLVVSIFGFMAMIAEKRSMLTAFGKMLLILLLLEFLILWLGLWGTGPMHLRTVMFRSFKSYETGNVRLDNAIDSMQIKFHCCGIDKPEDWSRFQMLETNNTSYEPASCCHIFGMITNSNECFSRHRKGCYLLVRDHIFRLISIVTAIGFGIAFVISLTIIPLFRILTCLEIEKRRRESRENLNTNLKNAVQVQPNYLNLHRTKSSTNNFISSTIV